MRAFFAIEASEEARRVAAAAAEELRTRSHGDGVRWVAPDRMHVTLRFLGQVEREQVSELSRRVGDAVRREPAFSLALDGVDGFPNSRRPRVVVLGLAPRAPALRLAAAVDRAVVDAGFPAEVRAFHPHLTLGRVRRGRRGPSLAPPPPVEPASVPVREIVLFQSRPSSGGSVYIPLERLALQPDHPQATDRQFQEE